MIKTCAESKRLAISLFNVVSVLATVMVRRTDSTGNTVLLKFFSNEH